MMWLDAQVVFPYFEALLFKFHTLVYIEHYLFKYREMKTNGQQKERRRIDEERTKFYYWTDLIFIMYFL